MKNISTDTFTEKLSRRMEKEIKQTFIMNEVAGETKANENERTGLEMLKVQKKSVYEAYFVCRILKRNWRI